MAIVTNINLVAGGPAVHVTVDDQNGNPLPPANISFFDIGGTVTIVADATGFLFSAGTSEPSGAPSTTAIYSGPLALAPVRGPTLTVNITEVVTALQYSTP